ncbi:ISL3 family transposase [Streptacidiphilus fuscans]|uniref:ISL3 family transposase n=1 Tax=Streptacidiphilus fuscans TaxID=2789292 RepID=A0A931B857_9ACTN|nr:ISL3 family transposase [Streptacidiphilus fuscans]MBF9071906.1 ISL3 family transposase [Streptacidiphilus fuscans]
MCAIEDVLFPGLDVQVEQLRLGDGLVEVEAAACGRPPICPDCGATGRRVHSSYWRTLADRPVGGAATSVRLRVRRFFCDRSRCRRRTFVEQVEDLTRRHERSTSGLRTWLAVVAAELGGRPAARLCRKLKVIAGRTRLLRLLQAPVVPERAPRVLGVDDFALRKRTSYATVLVDIEASRIIDVIPGRDSEALAAWLAAHPGAEVVCRDRAGAYSKAVRQEAPNALEVADRFHLLMNLTDVLEKVGHEHRSCLRKHAEQEARLAAPPEQVPLFHYPQTALLERIRHWHADVHQLHEQGLTVAAIARRLDLHWATVNKYVKTPLEDLLAAGANRRPDGVLDSFKAYLLQRQGELGTDATSSRLYRELRERGYHGSYRTVRRYVMKLADGHADPVNTKVPTPTTIAAWITRPREQLAQADSDALLWVRLACPDLARACDLAWAFLEMARYLRGNLLLEWIREAERDAPAPLRSFASYLRQDLAAVTAGLTPRMELRQGRGPRQPHQDDQEDDVRPRDLPAPPPTPARSTLIIHATAARPLKIVMRLPLSMSTLVQQDGPLELSSGPC